ncbi:Phosphatidylinositol phosphatase PTPRQ,Tyrosine-protein phosphatase 10D,Receptor-type tyrosine-protein phosphatase O [Mytilus coruscus]|uniref:Phosphatidylinositol phosphatase PTPRQ,Tyrosine-protein phosphatase 10D,Receptor-type tyrosine-protein phosphatase O n=1 Tax=Mytilus coruscus TaxID=42192 RepID=A0A6J8CFZ8_MYTCO|nr:Phosphatidylinositol phosphatase PTPRQ,Tyrosine-protein phosphatase 10D,Receptor-type tyrosine-protein phosphatase O [Mytilus coruscus]
MLTLAKEDGRVGNIIVMLTLAKEDGRVGNIIVMLTLAKEDGRVCNIIVMLTLAKEDGRVGNIIVMLTLAKEDGRVGNIIVMLTLAKEDGRVGNIIVMLTLAKEDGRVGNIIVMLTLAKEDGRVGNIIVMLTLAKEDGRVGNIIVMLTLAKEDGRVGNIIVMLTLAKEDGRVGNIIVMLTLGKEDGRVGNIIVMLTLAKEDGRIKCETYWPTEQSEAKQYGDIVVDMQSCSTINTYEFRIFKLTLGDKSRTLKHFHFLNWKDFSANVQNDVMVDFISNVRSHVTIPESRVPMIVHCSAGVGRTGTFIALDHMMQFIRDHDFNSVIDIFDLVVKMRECRMYMVQTEQQYIFIHDCIKDILEKKRQKELEDGEGLYGNVSNQNNQDNIYSNDAFEPDQDLYQNVDMAQPKTEL